MSTTSTSSASAPSSTTCGTPNQYQIPGNDASCAIPNSPDNKNIFNKCASPAPVKTYNGDCALYALAVDKSVKDLTDCLYDGGIDWKDVWCNGNETATATGSVPTKTDDATKTGDDASEPTESEGAAVSLMSERPSKTSLMILSFIGAAVAAGSLM